MSQSVERFIIPYNSIGYELRPSITVRDMLGTVRKAANEVMGLDIDTVKKEITVLIKKLTQKQNQLKHLQEQATRSSRTAIAYHAAKHYVKSVIGTKKSDAKQASHVQPEHSSTHREKIEEAEIVGVDPEKKVKDKYDPTAETPENNGKGGMPTPKSGHEKKGNWLQRMGGKTKGTPQHVEQMPAGHARKSLTKPMAKAGKFFKKVKGKAAKLFTMRKKT